FDFTGVLRTVHPILLFANSGIREQHACLYVFASGAKKKAQYPTVETLRPKYQFAIGKCWRFATRETFQMCARTVHASVCIECGFHLDLRVHPAPTPEIETAYRCRKFEVGLRHTCRSVARAECCNPSITAIREAVYSGAEIRFRGVLRVSNRKYKRARRSRCSGNDTDVRHRLLRLQLASFFDV